MRTWALSETFPTSSSSSAFTDELGTQPAGDAACGESGAQPAGGPCTSGSRPPGCGVLVTVTRSAARCRRQPCLPEDAGIAQTWRCASETLLLTPSQQVHVENWRDTRPGERTCVFIKPRARGKQPNVPATQGPQGAPQSAWSRAGGPRDRPGCLGDEATARLTQLTNLSLKCTWVFFYFRSFPLWRG